MADILANLIARSLARCPEHGSATERWSECRCAAAREAAARAAERRQVGPAAERAADLPVGAGRERQDAEATLARVRVIARRLAAHAQGFRDVLDDTDRAPWSNTVSADLDELLAALTLTRLIDTQEQS